MNPIEDVPLLAPLVLPAGNFQDENTRVLYQPDMVAFMNFIHNTNTYNKETIWPPNVLALITPEHIVAYFSTITFETLQPNDDSNAGIRVNTIYYKKKAISFFMLNKTAKWNESLKSGNPTMSTAVNVFIKYMKKKEVRRQGVKSKACRPLEPHEFISTMEKLNNLQNSSNPRQTVERRFMMTASLKFQFHMIARIDDTYRFLEEDIKVHPQFPFALQAQFRWSKNVMDERQAPNQIVLGSMDHHYCILLALGIYLESWYACGLGQSNKFLFGRMADGDKNKKAVSDFLSKSIWTEDEYPTTSEGGVGTHSARKFPSTYARRNGCQRDDVSLRGRWKDAKKIVDIYIDNYLPYPDAQVAQTLCIGGVCRYVLNEESGITEEWLLQHVVPNMLRSPYFSQHPRVALVLALPLLWASFDDEMERYMPSDLRSNIRNAYSVNCTLPPEVAPVRKTLMVVSGQDAMLHIDQILEAEGNVNVVADGNQTSTYAMPNQTNATVQAIYSQVVQLRQEVQGQFTTLGTRVQHLESRLENRVDIVNRNVQRIALQPAQRAQQPVQTRIHAEPIADERADPANPSNHVGDGDGSSQAIATLCDRPNSLHVLWQEYQHGVGNRKPAKDFTKAEKGRCRKTYYRRNLVWAKIDLLVRAGHLYNSACDMLQVQYGRTSSVTQIINKIIEEQPRSSKAARRQILHGRNARVQLN